MPSVRRATLAAMLMLTLIAPARAQASYPERGIRLLFGFPAGGDVITRLLADKLSATFGKPVIVENVTGAAGNIAADRTAKAAPDGHTVGLLTGANIAINVNLYRKLSFDPIRDLAPITPVFGYPNVLVVNNELPATSVAELVALARAAPGRLSFGHSGLGTTQHIAGELFKARARLDIQDVPYRGPPQIVTDLISGRIAMSFISPGAQLALMREGKIRPLAATSSKRAAFLPELPTMAEAGFPGFDITVWFGLFAPAGTPAPIIDRLNRETVRIMGEEDVRKRVHDLGSVPLASSPVEFAQLIKVETGYWAGLLKELGIKQID
jgi:tripartite-type tricarboxylate transporter receptor subunit TctC